MAIAWPCAARSPGLVGAFIEAPETGDFEHLLATRLRSLLLRLDVGGVSGAVKRALGTLKSLSYTLSDGTSIALNVDPIPGSADSGVLADDVTDLLVAAGDRERGLLLAIDEVQYLGADELAALITAIHRTVKSYAERLFDFPEIGSLEREDAMSVLTMPAQAR